jgi:hypothetical protein
MSIRKPLKKRSTVFFCGFMSGEIGKPTVVERAAKPPCFKSRDIDFLTFISKTKMG